MIVLKSGIFISQQLFIEFFGNCIGAVNLISRFIDENGEIRFSRNRRSIYLIKNKFHSLKNFTALEFFINIIQVEFDFLVFTKFVLVIEIESVFALFCPDFFQDGHCRIALVFYSSRVNRYLFQDIRILFKGNYQIKIISFQIDGLPLKTHKGYFNLLIGIIRFQVKFTFLIRNRSTCRAFENYVGKGNRIVVGIDHPTAHPNLS